MSDTSQGPGWWLASDGKWYPPELWTGAPGTGPSVQGAPAQGGAPSSSPPDTWPTAYGYGGAPAYPSGSGAPYQTSGYGNPPGMPYPAPGNYGQGVYGAVPAQKYNGLAIASLICSCLGLFFLPMILGIVFGFVARSQIRQSNGRQRGDALAFAGIIVGFCWAAFFVVTIIVGAQNSSSGSVVVPVLASLVS